MVKKIYIWRNKILVNNSYRSMTSYKYLATGNYGESERVLKEAKLLGKLFTPNKEKNDNLSMGDKELIAFETGYQLAKFEQDAS